MESETQLYRDSSRSSPRSLPLLKNLFLQSHPELARKSLQLLANYIHSPASVLLAEFHPPSLGHNSHTDEPLDFRRFQPKKHCACHAKILSILVDKGLQQEFGQVFCSEAEFDHIVFFGVRHNCRFPDCSSFCKRTDRDRCYSVD